MLIIDFPNQHGQHERLCFAQPEQVIVAHTLGEVRPVLREVAQAAARGRWVAGFVAYEAAPAFDQAFATLPAGPLPLLWFGVFREPAPAPPPAEPAPFAGPWLPDTPRKQYDRAIEAVRAAIAAGESYQANYTVRMRAPAAGDPLALYEQLRAAQNARYCAFLDLGRFQIVSASPELFFDWHGDEIITKPMKGTVRRGRFPAEDAARRSWLLASEKDRAENLMIVDLLRNDLGRVAVTGSVHVPELFAAEPYRTVWQLTSTVQARTRPGSTLEAVFAALFPCGSITGAPKIATMKLLAQLETTPRQVYCGAIGVVRPGGHATFNVAIRTVLIDAEHGQAEYGVGGGITWDSTPAGEYDEVLAKAALLSTRWPQFDLLETLAWDGSEYTLLNRHMERLHESAAYFSRLVDDAQVADLLTQHGAAHPGAARRVRLLVDARGSARLESAPLMPLAQAPLPVVLADTPVSSADPFLFHKTTARTVYDAHRSAHPDAFDVLLWNERGELTELTIGNLVAEIDGVLLTPPVSSGLLAGTMRAEMLERGTIREQVLHKDDLRRATRLWLINSVRGTVAVHLPEQSPF